jgi:UDP-N-acetylmuramoyl-L-alanyl-D-glutamate--2,6-diaminopimelate ligase
MKLAQLLQAIEPFMRHPASPMSIPDADVGSLAYDSRQVEAGALFVALKGLKASGADFAADAIARGAVAVVADQPPAVAGALPWIDVSDARAAMAALAAEFHGHPSRSMSVVGITGTNGKTTTAYL